MPAILYPLPKIVKKFNTIEYSGGTGILYVARADNHAYLGPAPLPELTAHIARSSGPSGSNRDYVLALADALRELDDPDPHVLALEALLLKSQAVWQQAQCAP